ncbi:MAG: ribonuclease HII [Verrucomicrobiota bacterium]|nr:ribonuclease HII [Verrucomicrobiota bacterium]
MGKTISVSNIDRLQYEREHVSLGLTRLAGVDEAGRGPLAGPVVAAAIVMPELWIKEGIPEPFRRLNDSKQLNEKVREELFEVIDSDKSIESGIGMVDAPLIDEINILQATHRAMNDALAKITPPVQHVLVDGRPVRSLSVSQTAIVKGDGKSYTIGAASILAKVTRDRLMIEYDQKYPGYGFARHKGYGTRAHLSAIEKLGPCPLHRMSFAPLRNTQTELFS